MVSGNPWISSLICCNHTQAWCSDWLEIVTMGRGVGAHNFVRMLRKTCNNFSYILNIIIFIIIIFLNLCIYIIWWQTRQTSIKSANALNSRDVGGGGGGGGGTIRGNHPTLATLTMIYMLRCASPSHETDGLTSLPKDGILLWINYPFLHVSEIVFWKIQVSLKSLF